tara:strand:+ start:468 stop:1172 length:705 start_codon:yes stop_codon:yes gene_type:complete
MYFKSVRNVIKITYHCARYLLGFISKIFPIGKFFYSIDETPSLEKASNKFFTDSLSKSKLYLEYGSGGSTVLASKLGINYITVETDLIFLNAVKNKVNQLGNKSLSNQKYIYKNIGLTSRWGHSLFPGTKRKGLLRKFRNYSDPKFVMKDKPDLIMIDGRFRAVTLLRMYSRLKSYSGWKVLFDDYFSREEYQIVSKFFKVDKRVGRLAVITETINCESYELDDAINNYIFDSY